MPMTSWPSATSHLAKCDPMNPAAPVTTNLTAQAPPVSWRSSARPPPEKEPVEADVPGRELDRLHPVHVALCLTERHDLVDGRVLVRKATDPVEQIRGGRHPPLLVLACRPERIPAVLQLLGDPEQPDPDLHPEPDDPR